MYNNRYQTFHGNTRSGFIPLIIGGVIGYGIGSNNRPNYYPIYSPIPMPYYQMPPYYFYQMPYRKK